MAFFPKLYLRCPFEIVEIAGEATAVGVETDSESYHGVIELKNETTKFMFEQLQKGITLPELIRACMDKYAGTSVEEAGPKVVAFLDQLRERGLLAADREHGIQIDDGK